MCETTPLAYQDFNTCAYTISSKWVDAHTSTKIAISKWVGLSSNEIRRMINGDQYKLKQHFDFIVELIEVVDTKRKGVKNV
jgi:hypothetical protein